MEFTQSATYPLDVDSVIRMSTDPAFLDMRFGRFMAANPEVTVEGDAITYVGTVDPELIPAIARPFTKNGITLTFTESWTRTDEGATAHTEVAVGGAPVSAAEYTGRDLLIESSRASGARRANRWVVGATGEGEDRESRYTAETTGYEYPYDPAGYGVVTDRNEMQIADGVSALYKAADTYRRNAQAAHGTRSLSIVPDPRLELWDTITVTVPHEAGPETLTGRVTATSLTIDKPDALMRVDLEVLSHA